MSNVRTLPASRDAARLEATANDASTAKADLAVAIRLAKFTPDADALLARVLRALAPWPAAVRAALVIVARAADRPVHRRHRSIFSDTVDALDEVLGAPSTDPYAALDAYAPSHTEDDPE